MFSNDWYDMLTNKICSQNNQFLHVLSTTDTVKIKIWYDIILLLCCCIVSPSFVFFLLVSLLYVTLEVKRMLRIRLQIIKPNECLFHSIIYFLPTIIFIILLFIFLVCATFVSRNHFFSSFFFTPRLFHYPFSIWLILFLSIFLILFVRFFLFFFFFCIILFLVTVSRCRNDGRFSSQLFISKSIWW